MLKKILSLVLKLAIVVLVWILLSYYYPRLSPERNAITEIAVTASPTSMFAALPALSPTLPPASGQGTELPATSTALPAPPAPLSAVNAPLKEIEISAEETTKGIMLTVTGGVENYDYRMGPLAEGVYALGPNRKFLVYVANNGMVYVSRLGESSFQKVEDARRAFRALNKQVDPYFELSFRDTGSVYILFIYEGRFGETLQVILPQTWTRY